MATGILSLDRMLEAERMRQRNQQFGPQPGAPSGGMVPPPPPPTPQPSFLQRMGTKLQDPTTITALAAAFDRMTLEPNAQLQQRASDMLAVRSLKDQSNQTIQMLMQSGDPQAMEVAKLIEADPINAKSYLQAYVSAKFKTPTETYTQMTGAQINAEMGIDAYDPETVYNVGVNSRKVTEIGGGGININMPDLTESQGAATNFYNRALNANQQLIQGNYESQGTQLGQAILGEIPFGNLFLSPEYQTYTALKSNFISAVLRKESGAAISNQEYANEEKKYFPQPGDKPQVIEEKRRAREDAIRGLRLQAGEGAGLVDKQKLPPNVTVKKL